MDIFVVTTGEYDDYRIQSVFSTREKAEKYVSQLDSDYYHQINIERYELDEHTDALERICWFTAAKEEEGILPAYPRETSNLASPNKRSDVSYVTGTDKDYTKRVIVVNSISYISAEHSRKLAQEGLQNIQRVKALHPDLYIEKWVYLLNN